MGQLPHHPFFFRPDLICFVLQGQTNRAITRTINSCARLARATYDRLAATSLQEVVEAFVPHQLLIT